MSHACQLRRARPRCIWDLFICCGAFLWRANAKRIYINCRAKALVSWPSSSPQALAPSLQLSHELSLPSILPALYTRGVAGEHEGMRAVPWCWAGQKELSLALIHAGASPMGQVLGARPGVPLLRAGAADEHLGFGLWPQVPKSSWLSAVDVVFKLCLSPFEDCPLLQT